MRAKSFQNVKDQIGFCGIYCGSCPAGNGAVIELTRIYQEIVKKNKLEKWAPKDFDFKEFMKGLVSIQKISSCLGCHQGGGNPTCKIRICAKERNIGSCSRCRELSLCENFTMLEKSHPRIKEELKKIENVSRQELMKKWNKKLKGRFPYCILFCNAAQP